MKILGLDTTTEACSVALSLQDQLISRYTIAPRKHTELLLPMVDEVLAEASITPADLDGLAVCRGPGAFTGVRIATGVVQGMALALGLPIVPVSSLAAIALRAHREFGAEEVISLIDARMGEVYFGAYRIEKSEVKEIEPECLIAPDQLPTPFSQHARLAGTGWSAYESTITAIPEFAGMRGEGDLYPHAEDVLTIARPQLLAGEGIAPEQLAPVYLRDKVVG